MFCQVTRLNHVKNHQDFVDKVMHVPIIITVEIVVEALGNSDTGEFTGKEFAGRNWQGCHLFVCFVFYFHVNI